VNRARFAFVDASGKGVNACRAIVRSGGTALHLTHTGGQFSQMFTDLCGRDEIELEAIKTNTEIRTCTTVVDLGTSTSTELVEECPPVEHVTWRLVLAKYRSLLNSSKAVLISGKPAEGYPVSAFGELTAYATEAKLPVVIDARGPMLVKALDFKPTLCKPNAQEFMETFDPGAVAEFEAVKKLAKTISKKYATAFLITRGPDPALFAYKGVVSELPVEKVEVKNAIGSGDACSGGIALSLAQGKDINEAVRFGLELASRNAESFRPGWI
jgi:fructose-1-phosphate kinase PfkB-like protein